MSAEGYLQIKIRELQEKIEELNKKVEFSLDRESRMTKIILGARERTTIELQKTLDTFISDYMSKKWDEEFEKRTQELCQKINTQIKLQGDSVNILNKSLLTEVALIKKDYSLLVNLILDKLNISEQDFYKICKSFDEVYPKDKINDYIKSNFKLIKTNLSKNNTQVGNIKITLREAIEKINNKSSGLKTQEK